MKRIGRTRARTTTLVATGALLISTITACAACADDSESLHGTWFGERNGYEVMWHFEAAGRMRLEDRRATWTVRQDTLVVDFDSFGEVEITERAVYRFLLSTPPYTPRRMFLRGFDLGLNGLLLTREEAADLRDDNGDGEAGEAGNDSDADGGDADGGDGGGGAPDAREGVDPPKKSGHRAP